MPKRLPKRLQRRAPKRGIHIFFKGLGGTVKNYTLLAGVLSLALVVLFYLWFQPGLVTLALYLLLALVAVVTVPVVYRLVGLTRRDEAAWLAEREESEYRDLSQRLKEAGKNLRALGIKEGVDQAEQLNSLIDDYHSVVETRFIGKEHLPLEYLGAARQVQKQAVQNLSDMVTLGHSLSTIDSNTFESPAQGGERLSRQTELQNEQTGRIRNLLDENYQMFDALTETAVEVANIDSFSRYERIDTLARLVSLSQIASSKGK